MPLNDLAKEFSLQSISDKTNISINSLEKLKNRDWQDLKETQVIGFIRIIEREFKIDLNELEADARAYYKEHKAKENHNPLDIVDVAEVKSENKIISGVVTVITLAVVAYASWYYLQDKKEKDVQNIELNNTSSNGMFQDTLSNVKSMLGISANQKAKDKKSSEANTTVVSSEQNSTKASQTSSIESNESNIEQTTLSSNGTQQSNFSEHKKFDITAAASTTQSTTEQNSSSIENNETQNRSNIVVSKEDNNSSLVTDTNASSKINSSSEENSSIVVNQDSNLSEENSSLGSTKEDALENKDLNESNGSAKVDLEANSTEDTTNSATVKDNSNKVQIDEITIKPLSKRLWLGIYDLDKKKRINKFITSQITFPIKGHYAVITGHNKLEISSKMGVVQFKKRGRAYFLLSKDGIKKIDLNEYKKVTNNSAW